MDRQADLDAAETRSPGGRSTLRGATVALAWVAGLYAAAPLLGGFPLTAVAQAAVFAAPGRLATFVIEAFGKGALDVAVVGVAAGVVGAGTALGAASHRLPAWLRSPGATTVALLGTTVGLLGYAGAALTPGVALGVVAAMLPPVVALGVWARTRQTWTPAPDRRRLLGRLGVSLTAAAGLGALSRTLPGAFGVSTGSGPPGAGADFSADVKRDLGRTEPAGDQSGTAGAVVDSDEPFAFEFAGMPGRVTSVDDHYVVDAAASDPSVPADDYTLDVTGLVEEGRSYTYEALLDHEALTTETVTMVCISNVVGGELVSTSHWHGIPVSALVEEAGATDAVEEVVTHAADGYHEAIPLDVARRDEVMLAVGQNGERLTRSHGYPLRLLIPGRYGMKSTKWVTEVELVGNEHISFWERRGWADAAVVNTLSYLRGAERRHDRVAVGGVAYAGLRGIQRVEVSVDGGDTFRDAELEDAPGEYAWRRFQYVFEKPDRGEFEAVARATDGEGTRQTAERSPPHPGGSTGLHRRTFDL